MDSNLRSFVDNNEEGYFQVGPNTNIISLARELDRSVQASHVVRVAASNTPLDPAAPPPLLPTSTFLLTINVSLLSLVLLAVQADFRNW